MTDYEQLRFGDRVLHSTFGAGTVNGALRDEFYLVIWDDHREHPGAICREELLKLSSKAMSRGSQDRWNELLAEWRSARQSLDDVFSRMDTSFDSKHLEQLRLGMARVCLVLKNFASLAATKLKR